jgi:hypothetical protein
MKQWPFLILAVLVVSLLVATRSGELLCASDSFLDDVAIEARIAPANEASLGTVRYALQFDMLH